MPFFDILNQYVSSFIFGYLGALIFECFVYVNMMPYLGDINENNKSRNRLIIYPLIGGVFICAVANFGGSAWQLIGGLTSIGFLERVTGIEQNYKNIISSSKEEKVSKRKQELIDDMAKNNGPQIDRAIIEDIVSKLELKIQDRK